MKQQCFLPAHKLWNFSASSQHIRNTSYEENSRHVLWRCPHIWTDQHTPWPYSLSHLWHTTPAMPTHMNGPHNTRPFSPSLFSLVELSYKYLILSRNRLNTEHSPVYRRPNLIGEFKITNLKVSYHHTIIILSIIIYNTHSTLMSEQKTYTPYNYIT